MKAFRFFQVVIILSGILLSACAGAPGSQSAPNTSPGGDKPVSEVVFTGTIESMNGDQWVINGQTVIVDPSVLRDGPFMTGDSVKVEARVAGDGSVTAQRVESPSAADLAGSASATSTPGPVSTASTAVAGSSPEITGTVEAMTDTTITLDGQTFTLAPGAEIKNIITVGMVVKLHFVANPDGSLSVREVEIANPAGSANNDDNSNSTNGNDNSSGDDNGNGNNSNDDNGNDDNSNDDSGNDNASNDDNSNDSNGSG